MMISRFDMSDFLIPKQGKRKKLRAGKDKNHLMAVSKLPCCCGGRGPVQVHHLLHEPRYGKMYGLKHGTGLKNDDRWVVPLSCDVHARAHQSGRPEDYVMDRYGVNLHELAIDLYRVSGDHMAMVEAIFLARRRFYSYTREK